MSQIGPHLRTLIELGSAPIEGQLVVQDSTLDDLGGSSELLALLGARNGFYAFESALLVRGLGADAVDIRAWNRKSLWRDSYDGLDHGLTFFAEDVFGSQFGFAGSDVVAFDAETAERVVIADSLDAWAAEILRDYSLLTGHPLAHAWQQEHGALTPGYRLVPTVPFVLGGDYALSNLGPVRDAEAMRTRGALAKRIHGAPDGTSVEMGI
ncbi:SMI1/KNR4 family protein [Cryocola sp. 340MFSha3.1]|uniref:SMI1/KNR4 family protein n=1 Tax=Cryocola sp. 340MFSha3.1 TaxID=1169145 RepID=UPI000367BFBD|nr:SMI1/KNR4 family protein [Cryocola sp. 340MFSha3.1]